MSPSTRSAQQSRILAAGVAPRGLSPRLLAAPLFVALAVSAVGHLLGSADARERFAAFAVSH